MTQTIQQPPASPWLGYGLAAGGSDLSIQLQRTRQWEADGSHLLRAAAFHAWAASGLAAPQST